MKIPAADEQIGNHPWPDFRYEFVQRLNHAMRWLRAAEDYARLTGPGRHQAADRVRAVHEKLTADVLNGKTTEPTDEERGYTQAIKDVVEALRELGRGPEGKGSNYEGLIYDDAADFIESRFSAPSPGPEGEDDE